MKRIVALLLLVLLTIASLSSKNENGETFALVLGGGGARGYAHIAVIRELEKRGVTPDWVIGTSMGALIGGLYAAGYTADEIEAIALDNDINALVHITNLHAGDISFDLPDSDLNSNILIIDFGKDGFGSSSGILNDQEINGFIREKTARVLSVTDFDSLPIPLRTVASDIRHGERHVFSDGDLFTALRASMSLPLVFPWIGGENGDVYMDGGMVDIVPANVAKELGADYILSVDVSDTLHANERKSLAELDTLTGAFWGLESFPSILNVGPNYEISTWILVPDLVGYSTLNFAVADEIIQIGEKCVEEHIDIFDFIGEKFGGDGKDQRHYYEIETVPIKAIDSSSVPGYEDGFLRFLGRPIDNDTLSDLEEFIGNIAKDLKLKNVGYTIKDGIITINKLEYEDLVGSVFVGAAGAVGMKLNPMYGPYFAFAPGFSLGFQKGDEKNLFSLGVKYDYTLGLEGRYARRLGNDTRYFIGLDLDFMNLNYLTNGLSYGATFRSDVMAGLETGFYWELPGNVRIDLLLNFDYTHLQRTLNPLTLDVEDPPVDEIHPYGQFNLAYEDHALLPFIYDINMLLSLGVGVDYAFDGSTEAKEVLPSYDIRFSLSSRVGGGALSFTSEIEADTLRRYSRLKSAYLTTKGGVMTPDYLYGFIGLGIDIKKFFIEIGPFAEGFHHQEKIAFYLEPNFSSVPFMTIDSWSVGGRLKVGLNTSFGDLYIDSYFGYMDGFMMSLMFGIGI